jgi:hypothetical protein
MLTSIQRGRPAISVCPFCLYSCYFHVPPSASSAADPLQLLERVGLSFSIVSQRPWYKHPPFAAYSPFGVNKLPSIALWRHSCSYSRLETTSPFFHQSIFLSKHDNYRIAIISEPIYPPTSETARSLRPIKYATLVPLATTPPLSSYPLVKTC